MSLFRRCACVVAAVSIVTFAGACTEDTPRAELDLPESPEDIDASVGEVVSYEGITTEVRRISSFEQTATGFPRLSLVMRSENTSDRAGRNPRVDLVCDENPTGGDWNTGSTWESDSTLPAGAVRQGELIVSFPSKSSSPLYPVGKCTSPRMRMIFLNNLGAAQTVHVPVPDEAIGDAIDAPRGPDLPLPLDIG